jgi:FAD/FMN-containing dehydrogenase
VRKNSSGYALERFLPVGDALDLFVGSEGTLGVVTRARVRIEREPEVSSLLLLALRDPADMVEAALAAGKERASACEVLGRRILEMAGLDRDPRIGQLARGAEALLLVELSGPEEAVHESRAELRRRAGEWGSGMLEARGDEDALTFWELRRRASPSIALAAAEGFRSTQFIEDSVVPLEQLPAYLAGLEEILADASTDAVIFGHLGDGHLHVNPLIDMRRRGWRDTVRRILEETVGLVASLGGTLSGEHGDGRLRAPYLARVWPEPVVTAFREVKRALDPAGVFNPGVILPLPDQDPLEGVWRELPATAPAP